MIFVFASNRAGIHDRDTALYAYCKHGARLGIGEGRTGNAYAIPVADEQMRGLSLAAVAMHVDTFLDHARATPQLYYEITLSAAYSHLFRNAPSNCHLPIEWTD